MNSIPIQLTELLNHSCTIAKMLLKEQEEFYPFGVSMDYEGNIHQRLVDDGDEFPLSEVLIGVIQKDFDARLANRSISAYAVIYDARVSNIEYPEGTDAVVARVKGIQDQSTEIYYLPYDNGNGTVKYFEPWGETMP